MASTIFDKIKGLLPEEWTGKKPVKILITGKTGTGKSALINGVVGAEVAEEGGGLKRGTAEVHAIEHVKNDVKIVIWDTPSLQDIVEEGEVYLEKMQGAGCADADLVLYCTKMDDTRLRQDDIEAIKKLTQRFGKEIWDHALFILTFANKVEKIVKRKKGEPRLSEEEIKKIKTDYFKKRIQEWKEELDQALIKAGVPIEATSKIIPVPAGYDEEIGLPDRENWLTPLWYACIIRMKPSSQAGLLKANIERIKRPEDVTREDFDQPLSEQPILAIPASVKYGAPPAIFTAIGAVVGGAVGIIGGPAGMAVGGVAGGAAGAGLGGIVSVVTAYFKLRH